MLLGARIGSFGGAAKPYQRELAYLQSTGTQYINTGYSPKSNSGILIDFIPLAKGGSAVPIGCRVSGTDSRFWVNPSTYMTFGFGKYYSLSAVSIATGTRYAAKMNYLASGKGEVGTASNTLGSFPGCSYPVYIFCANVSGTASFLTTSLAKVYEVKLTEGNEIVADFIPVIDLDGVPCFYDKVSGEFKYNAGSGSFSYG